MFKQKGVIKKFHTWSLSQSESINLASLSRAWEIRMQKAPAKVWIHSQVVFSFLKQFTFLNPGFKKKCILKVPLKITSPIYCISFS